jgi:hypothetical protein
VNIALIAIGLWLTPAILLSPILAWLVFSSRVSQRNVDVKTGDLCKSDGTTPAPSFKAQDRSGPLSPVSDVVRSTDGSGEERFEDPPALLARASQRLSGANPCTASETPRVMKAAS